VAPEDRALAERVHVTVTTTAPELSPKTWYGMPAYANADGKVVVCFQNAGKFSYRYSALGFNSLWRVGAKIGQHPAARRLALMIHSCGGLARDGG
jgi:hypothetical protein